MTATSTSVDDLRQIRMAVTLLANGRGVEMTAAAVRLSVAAVKDIHQRYGPGRPELLTAAADLQRQLDAATGPGPSTPPERTPNERPSASRPTPAPAPQPAPPHPSAGGFQAGMVPLSKIAAHPSNIKRNLGDLRDLAASIKKSGVRVPVVLEQHGGRYRLRDGHRRVAAAQLAGVARVPAIVHAKALDEKDWLLESIDYNLRRQGYTEEDKRRVARQLDDLGVDRRGIAQAFGITPAKAAALLAPDVVEVSEPTPRVHRTPSVVGRRLVLHAVEDWRTRKVDATTILTELEQLLTTPAPTTPTSSQ